MAAVITDFWLSDQWSGGASILGTVEEVYTNAFDARVVDWLETGASPYLDDSDATYVRTATDALEEGDWTFPATAGSGTINSVKLRLKSYATVTDCGTVDVYVWNGATWVSAGSFYPAKNVYTWYELDVSATLNTWAKIATAEVSVQYSKEVTGTVYVNRLTRKIDYTLAGGLSIPVAMHHYSQTRRTRIAD